MIAKLTMIAAGGAIGAVLRYLAAAWFGRLVGAGFIGTMFVNVVGSFAMGVLAAMMLQGGARPFLMTGLLGGFTTFSAFSLDAVVLFERGEVALGGAYVAGSLVLSVAALVAGLALARALA